MRIMDPEIKIRMSSGYGVARIEEDGRPYLLLYSEGELDGRPISFETKAEAEEFARINEDKGSHVVVKLSETFQAGDEKKISGSYVRRKS